MTQFQKKATDLDGLIGDLFRTLMRQGDHETLKADLKLRFPDQNDCIYYESGYLLTYWRSKYFIQVQRDNLRILVKNQF